MTRGGGWVGGWEVALMVARQDPRAPPAEKKRAMRHQKRMRPAACAGNDRGWGGEGQDDNRVTATNHKVKEGGGTHVDLEGCWCSEGASMIEERGGRDA